MASVIRRLVSQQKRRYQQDGFDLDLAYITPRIIAMGLPAEGLTEALYRNPMSEAARFLAAHHPGAARVYNLCSERCYGAGAFGAHGGGVVHLALDDHQAAPLALMLAFCRDASRWLAAGAEHVVVVHCKAGKGRTGVMICALLLHLAATESQLANFPAVQAAAGGGDASATPAAAPTGVVAGAGAGTSPQQLSASQAGATGPVQAAGVSVAAGASSRVRSHRLALQAAYAVDLTRLGPAPVEQVLRLYGARRTLDHRGVTIPSQRRCVAYYWQVLQAGCLPPPRPLQLRCLTLSGLSPGSAPGLSLAVTVHGAAPCFSAAPPCACSTPLLTTGASGRHVLSGGGGRSSGAGGAQVLSRSPSTSCLEGASAADATASCGGAGGRRLPRTSSWSVGSAPGGSAAGSRQAQDPRVWTFHGPAAFTAGLGGCMASGCQSPLVWDDPSRSRITTDPAGTTLTVELPPSCLPLVHRRDHAQPQQTHQLQEPQVDVPLPGASEETTTGHHDGPAQQRDCDQASVISSTDGSGIMLDGAVRLQVLQHQGKPAVLATAWLHTAFLPAGGATTLSRAQLDKVAPGLPPGATLTLRCDEAHPAAASQEPYLQAGGGSGAWGAGGWGWQAGGGNHRGGGGHHGPGTSPSHSLDLGRLGSWAGGPGSAQVTQQHAAAVSSTPPGRGQQQEQQPWPVAADTSARQMQIEQQAAAPTWPHLIPEQLTGNTDTISSGDSSGRQGRGALTQLLAAVVARAPAFASSSNRSAGESSRGRSHSQPLPAVAGVASGHQVFQPLHPAPLPSAAGPWGAGEGGGRRSIELPSLRSAASAPASPAGGRVALHDTAGSGQRPADTADSRLPLQQQATNAAAAAATAGSSAGTRNTWLGRQWGGSSGAPHPLGSSSSQSAPCSPARRRPTRAVPSDPLTTPASSATLPNQQHQGAGVKAGVPLDEAALQQLLGALEGSWREPRRHPLAAPANTHSSSSWCKGVCTKGMPSLPRSRSSPGRAGGSYRGGRSDDEEASPLRGHGSCYSDASSTYSEEGSGIEAAAAAAATAPADAAAAAQASHRAGVRRCVTSSGCDWQRGGLAPLSEAAEQQQEQEGEVEAAPPTTSRSPPMPGPVAHPRMSAGPPRSSSASWWLSWLQQQQPGPQKQVLGGGTTGAAGGPLSRSISSAELETAALLSAEGGAEGLCDAGNGRMPFCADCPVVVVAPGPPLAPAKRGAASSHTAAAGLDVGQRVGAVSGPRGGGRSHPVGDAPSRAAGGGSSGGGGGSSWSSLELSWQRSWWV